MPTITFEPLGAIVDASLGDSIFEAGRRAGVPIPTACVGRATCGLCRVKILAGEAALSVETPEEEKHLGNTYFITKLRLGCQVRLVGEGAIVVRLPDAKKKR
jgi:ferredoxin